MYADAELGLRESLGGKKVLFIAPRFFGYETEIAQKLRSYGAEVRYFDNRPSSGSIVKALIRIEPRLLKPVLDRYFASIIEQTARERFDIVLVIKGEGMSPDLLSGLRRHHGSARFVLYLWDSLKNNRHVDALLPHFDAALTFDPMDAGAGLQLKFRPLFFLDDFRMPKQEGSTTADLLFVGTIHGDRYSVIRKVARTLPPGSQFTKYMFFPAKWLFWARRLTQPEFAAAKLAEFSFVPMKRADLVRLMQNSRAILDIEHRGQTGLTMRTIECIGARKKLVTTNQEVRTYDFFDPENVHVLDRETPEIPADFLSTPVRELDRETYLKYSIDGWLADVLQA